MKKLSIGIDAHKATNVIGLAFDDMTGPQLYGKVSADLKPSGIRDGWKRAPVQPGMVSPD